MCPKYYLQVYLNYLLEFFDKLFLQLMAHFCAKIVRM